ncbi:hypothetical protein FGB62_74g18 [Gracilaria domingensis]|nr:hypothetical protein FGB62_74g18 [Gracilaria domingensis]
MLLYSCADIKVTTSSKTDSNLPSRTKELLADVTHKGFFGFTGTRALGGGFVGLTNEEEEMRNELWDNDRASNKRSVNVINLNDLNPNYAYNEEGIIRGRYEEWTTNPICSGAGRSGMVTMDIRNPITGIVSSTKSDESVSLGSEKNGVLTRHDGSSRLMRIRDFAFGDSHCQFASDTGDDRPADGTFYTDASGRTLMSGPSETSVRQFVKRGFGMEMDGVSRYIVTDPWGGELAAGLSPGQSSDGYGLDPNVN